MQPDLYRTLSVGYSSLQMAIKAYTLTHFGVVETFFGRENIRLVVIRNHI